MATFLYPIFAIALLWLFFRLWRLRKSSDKRAAGVLILQVVIFFWLFDNLIISIGRFVGGSDLLQRLSQVRLLTGMTFVPLLMVTVMDFAYRSEVRWVQSKIIRGIVWLLGLTLMAFSGVIEWQLQDDLVLHQFMGALQYVHSSGLPPFLPLVTYLVIAILGVLIWRKMKWFWVLLGGLVAFGGSFFAQSPVGSLVMAGAGIVLVGCLVATERRLLTPDYSLSDGELNSRLNQVTVARSKKSL